jgi:hypothetical protein
MWELILGFLWDRIDENFINRFKRFGNWIRNAPIKLDLLILYIAIGNIKKDTFESFCEKLKSVYKFEINEVTNDVILTHSRTLIISKNGLQLKLYLINVPSLSHHVRESYTLKLELMSQQISYKDGINNLKTILGEIITCAQTVFKSGAKFTYKMRLKDTKKIDLNETAYKIHITGNKATIESNNLDSLQKIIALTSL